MSAASSSSSSDSSASIRDEIATARGAAGGRVVGDRRRHRVVALVDVGHEQHRLAGQRREVAQRVRRGVRAPARCAPAGRPCSASITARSHASSAIAAVAAARRRAPRARGGARPARGRRTPARSRSSRCRRPDRPCPSGWMTFSSWCARTTCSSASVSRMLARNWLPSPSPLCAPATRPAMSWNSIVSGTTLEAPIVRATASSRSSATGTHRDVRLDRRERVVRGLRAGARERVEERRLARVGHPDDADLHHRPRLPSTVPSAAPAATSDG